MPALTASISGMSAAFRLLNTTAHNIANSNTIGFKRQEAALSEAKGGGVAVSVGQNNEAGPKYWLDGKMFEGSNVDMAGEMVSLITAKQYFSFNSAVFRTASEMEKSLVDTFA